MQHTIHTDKIIHFGIKHRYSLREISRHLKSYWTLQGEPQFVSPDSVARRARARGWSPIPEDGFPEFEPAYGYPPRKPKPTPVEKKTFCPKALPAPVDKYEGHSDAITPKRKQSSAKMSPAAKAVLRLKNNQCKWPLGEPSDRDFHFCGERREDGEPYCCEHLRKRVRQFPLPA